MEYLITFTEGLASFISPCVLPIIPVYISYFAVGNNTKKTFINALGFVLGFTIIFVLLGVFASTFGKIVHEYIAYINIVFGLFLIILGLNYMGVLFVKFLNKTKGIKQNNNNLTFIKSLLFGILFSLTWTPCVGAFLSSALILATTSGSVLIGTILLFLYSLGLGIPFIITAIFTGKVTEAFEVIKKHYNIINKIAGLILILMGLWNIINSVINIFS